jgi:hypothetical protein
MQELRKLEDGFEIDGKSFRFNEVQSIKYHRSRIQHVGVVHANMANDELCILIKGAYKPIKIASLSKVYIAYLSEKSSKQKSVIVDDFYEHIYKNTATLIYNDYETKLKSTSGLQYDCITLSSTGEVTYDGGSFNLKNNAPECFLAYPNLEFRVGFGGSVGKSFMRALKGNLSVNLQVDITTDTNIFLAILKNYFGYKFT